MAASEKPPLSDKAATLKHALRRLTARDQSEHDLRRGLQGLGFRSSAIDDALRALRRVGYLDDRAYAERYADRSLRLRRLGPRRILQALSVRGVGSRHARSGISHALDTTSETSAIRSLAVDFWRRRASVPQSQRLAQLYLRLVRRGFSSDKIAAELRRLHPGQGDTIDAIEASFDSVLGEDD